MYKNTRVVVLFNMSHLGTCLINSPLWEEKGLLDCSNFYLTSINQYSGKNDWKWCN